MVVGGQKGLVEESDLKIPNMRGIMQARQKPLEVISPKGFENITKVVLFEKPAPKADVKLVPADDIDLLVELLQKEANVI